MPDICYLSSKLQGCTQINNWGGGVFIYLHSTRLLSFEIDCFYREMATKSFIVSFERESKTIYRSLLQNFFICLISLHILIRNIKLSAILDICRCA